MHSANTDKFFLLRTTPNTCLSSNPWVFPTQSGHFRRQLANDFRGQRHVDFHPANSGQWLMMLVLFHFGTPIRITALLKCTVGMPSLHVQWCIINSCGRRWIIIFKVSQLTKLTYKMRWKRCLCLLKPLTVNDSKLWMLA